MKISLRAARINAKLTQKESAERLGVDVTTIGKWENGKTSPKAAQLERLCSIYGVPIDYIFLQY